VRAISYIRYSSKEQAKGRSEARQKEASARYCERRGWTLDDTLRMDRGVSGWKGKNAKQGELASILHDITTGKIPRGSALIVESLDRISRQGIDEGYDLLKTILRAGVRIVTLNPEREYDETAIKGLMLGALELQIILERAQEESNIKSVRVRDSWAARRTRRQPMTSVCPFWLTLKDKRYVLVPEKVALVRRIFTMLVAGDSINHISKTLNEEKVPCPGKGKQWTSSYISAQLLGKKLVLGEYQPRLRREGKQVATGEPIIGYYPPAIDAELYYRAIGLNAARPKIPQKQGTNCANLFTGLIIDANDKGNMICRRHKGRKMLQSHVALVNKGAVISCDYLLFENAFTHFIGGLELDDDTATNAINAQIQETQGIIADKDTRIAKATKLLASNGDFEEMATVLQELKTQRNALKDRLADLTRQAQSASTDHAEAKDIIDQMEDAKAEGKEGEMRARLKTKIRALVKGISLEIEPRTRYERFVRATITLRTGETRVITLEYHSREKWGCKFGVE
jgi:DNA invertase Pin-like site-specific DNA recombinase